MRIRRVNFFGGPGVGKSSIACHTFAELKALGCSVEYVYEQIKLWTYVPRPPKSWDSFYMQARQIYFEDTILRSGTDLIVSDSPVFLQWFYARHHVAPGQDAMFMSGREFETIYPSLNILLTRPEDVDYQAEGRYEDHEQAKTVDAALKELLSDIAYITFKEFSYRNREEIVAYVKKKLEL